MTYHLAVDIGASSGRHILGHIDEGKLVLEEIYRFENNLSEENGSLVWDIQNLVSCVKEGIKKCGEAGKIPKTVAIDTWGVDYVLLDGGLNELLPVYCYRDGRTNKITAEVHELCPKNELYKKTGIQFQPFNTIYQLYCDKLSGKLNKAKYFMMMPAYLSYKLTGVVANEYTNATTTGMVNAHTKTWDEDIIGALGYDAKLLGALSLPQSVIGDFSEDMQRYAGFNSTVVFCPSHDTASAVAACPLEDNSLYVSSGTWSLIGLETKEPILSEKAQKANFANEGGIDFRFRFLKNYMGMWLFQNIRRNIDKSMTYDEMMRLAESTDKYYYIDVNAPEFVAPENMLDAIRDYLKMPKLSLGEALASVYHSLAKSYNDAVTEIETLTGKSISALHIVGGGSRDEYLNRLTARYTGKTATAGPVEATAVGNLVSQIIFSGEAKSIDEARELVKNSFNIKEV